MTSKVFKHWTLAVSLLLLSSAGAAFAQVVSVDCDQGESLAAAVSAAAAGTRIEVSGTCFGEEVSVSTNGISINGIGEATLSGINDGEDLLTVIGPAGVVLTNLVLENGGRGLSVVNGAAVSATGIISRDNLFEGFHVEGSLLRLTDSQASNNGDEGIESLSSTLALTGVTSRGNRAGLRAANGGNVRFFGNTMFRDNRGVGISIEVGASAFGLLANVRTLANQADGFDLIGGSAQFIGGTLRSRINGGHGIALAAGASLQLGSATIPITTEVITNANGLDGIFATDSSSLRLSGFAEVQSRGNESGINLRQGSSARLSGVEATNNRAWGVVADDASLNLFASRVESNGSNRPDLFLRFGSRATVGTTVIGTLGCEPSVLIRGEDMQGQPIVCP